MKKQLLAPEPGSEDPTSPPWRSPRRSREANVTDYIIGNISLSPLTNNQR